LPNLLLKNIWSCFSIAVIVLIFPWLFPTSPDDQDGFTWSSIFRQRRSGRDNKDFGVLNSGRCKWINCQTACRQL
jgi:hypothetical protein